MDVSYRKSMLSIEDKLELAGIREAQVSAPAAEQTGSLNLHPVNAIMRRDPVQATFLSLEKAKPFTFPG